jgi:natural resistance-associated macrophage protein
VIWGVGLLAAGQAATMTATFAGQIVMDGFLDIKLPQWQRVLLTRAAALGPALAVSVATGSNTALFNNINEWLNVLQSIQLPFAMLPVLKLTCMASVMGEDFRTQGK